MSTNYGISEYPNTFKRQGSFPLDQSSKFDNYESAVEYAKTSPIAYEGQIISIVENEDIRICYLKTSDTAGINFDLIDISVSPNIGTWSINNLMDGEHATVIWEILYPITIDSYAVYSEGENISTELAIGQPFTMPSDIFNQSNVNIYMEFYKKVTDENDAVNNVLVCSTQARVKYRNNVVILGDLEILTSK